jgi:hypothetical protein
MKVFISLFQGARLSIKSWKGVLITWLFSLILVSTLAVPLRGALNSAFGSSMITELLQNGFNPAVFADLGHSARVIAAFFSTGLLFLIFSGFLMNVFLTGGLFGSVRKDSSINTFQEFFRVSAKRFGSFLVISVITRMIINFISGIVIAIPIIILTTSTGLSSKTSIIIAAVSGLLTISVIPTLLLVADYARAWQSSNERSAAFSAIGFGFGETFRSFWSSFPMMLLILIIQVFYLIFVFLIISGKNPLTGKEVFLLFLVSQLLVFIKILLKTWRFGSVTALMEANLVKESTKAEAEGNFL